MSSITAASLRIPRVSPSLDERSGTTILFSPGLWSKRSKPICFGRRAAPKTKTETETARLLRDGPVFRVMLESGLGGLRLLARIAQHVAAAPDGFDVVFTIAGM